MRNGGKILTVCCRACKCQNSKTSQFVLFVKLLSVTISPSPHRFKVFPSLQHIHSHFSMKYLLCKYVMTKEDFHFCQINTHRAVFSVSEICNYCQNALSNLSRDSASTVLSTEDILAQGREVPVDWNLLEQVILPGFII